MAIRLVDYRVQGDLAGLTLGEAKTVIETIDRGLWKRNHSVLRDDVASLRHDLRQSSALTDDLRQRVTETIERFNALDPSSLNRGLLDDASLPRGGSPRPTTPAPATPAPTPTAPTEPNPTGATIDEIGGLLDTKLTPLVAILPKDAEGNLVPVAAQSAIVELKRDVDELKAANTPLRWGLAFIIGLLTGAVFYVITGIAWGWTAMVIPALAVTLAVAVGAALLLPKKQQNPTNNQPRG